MTHDDMAIPATGDYRLSRVRVPQCLLASPAQGAAVSADGAVLLDIDVADGRIARVAGAHGEPDGLDCEGRMAWPALVDMHTHLDKGEVIPRVQADGSLDGGATGTAADYARWTEADMTRRMDFALRCAHAHGVGAIRTHLDCLDRTAARSWDVFRQRRDAWAERIVLQAVGLTPLESFTTDYGPWLADLVAASGGVLGGVTDTLGGLPGATPATIDALLDGFLETAGVRGLDVDLHVDQSADTSVFFLPDIARAVLRTRFAGRVVVGHCVNLALQPDAVARPTIELCAEAGLRFVTLPTPMMYLMDRAPGRTPRWRGVTLAQEIRAAGIPIAMAGDNCRDAWYPYGDHDMVDIFRQGVRIFHFDHPADDIPSMVGPIPADSMGLADVGRIGVGAWANLILFRARSLNEVLSRPQSDRIVLSRGRPVVGGLPDYSELDG